MSDKQLLENQIKVSGLTDDLINVISGIDSIDEKIEVLNYVRKRLHEISPMRHHPVDYVVWEKSENIEGNEYNPNSVAPPEMNLLIRSIIEDGYTMPVVTYKDEQLRIVDGFHRRKSERVNTQISRSTHGRIPITFIRDSQKDLSNRMASTIRHNRARGTHKIDLMVNIVKELKSIGQGDAWIMKNIGMDADELLRLKQLSGLIELFKDKQFSNSWEI